MSKNTNYQYYVEGDDESSFSFYCGESLRLYEESSFTE